MEAPCATLEPCFYEMSVWLPAVAAGRSAAGWRRAAVRAARVGRLAKR